MHVQAARRMLKAAYEMWRNDDPKGTVVAIVLVAIVGGYAYGKVNVKESASEEARPR
jgi:hypothetical protein